MDTNDLPAEISEGDPKSEISRLAAEREFLKKEFLLLITEASKLRKNSNNQEKLNENEIKQRSIHTRVRMVDQEIKRLEEKVRRG
jgi:hypothetical protein